MHVLTKSFERFDFILFYRCGMPTMAASTPSDADLRNILSIPVVAKQKL